MRGLRSFKIAKMQKSNWQFGACGTFSSLRMFAVSLRTFTVSKQNVKALVANQIFSFVYSAICSLVCWFVRLFLCNAINLK